MTANNGLHRTSHKVRRPVSPDVGSSIDMNKPFPFFPLLILSFVAFRSFSFASSEEPSVDKFPIYFECRNNQLFHISLENINKAFNEKTDILREQVDSNPDEFIKLIPGVELEVDGYRVDYLQALAGAYDLQPIPEGKSDSLKDRQHDSDTASFNNILQNIDPSTQYLHFFVRPNSLDLFNTAKESAGIRDITVTYTLYDDNQNIRIRLGSSRDTWQ